MIDAQPDVLGLDPRPLCFEVADAEALDLAPAAPRHGASVRTWVRTLAGMQKEAITVNGAGQAAWRFASDEGPYLAGNDVGPCPLSFFTTGMVASYTDEILAAARRHELVVRDLRLVLDNLYTMRGSALRGTMIGGALAPLLRVEIDAEAPVPTLIRLVGGATRSAPVAGLLGGVHESLFTLRHNGVEVTPERVGNLEGAVQPDPKTLFSTIEPISSHNDHPIRKLSDAERVRNEPGGINSSLKDSQDRRLHCRGVCTVREDGIRQIDQTLFEPIGSSFRFLSEEAVGAGGHGRAPDAASYISAGIAFCFMTQFGRYAEITKRTLDVCRIVQDTYFSAGSASGEKGVDGMADAVETHVYLETPHEDGFARTALDMSEQTCFLHAMCRTDLATRVEVRSLATSPDSL